MGETSVVCLSEVKLQGLAQKSKPEGKRKDNLVESVLISVQQCNLMLTWLYSKRILATQPRSR